MFLGIGAVSAGNSLSSLELVAGKGPDFPELAASASGSTSLISFHELTVQQVFQSTKVPRLLSIL